MKLDNCPFECDGVGEICAYPTYKNYDWEATIKCSKCGATGPIVDVGCSASGVAGIPEINKALEKAGQLWNARSSDKSPSPCRHTLEDGAEIDRVTDYKQKAIETVARKNRV